MNLLAHLHAGQGLSPTESAGNLTADFCRDGGAPAFERGVQFHRAVDAFTDTHPAFAEARSVFTGKLRRFGGVLADLAFDLCLSRTWSEWGTPAGREDFIDTRLGAVTENPGGDIPMNSLAVIQRMKEERWLHHYREPEGIRASIARLAARRPVASRMTGAERVIEKHYNTLAAIFRSFYPQLLGRAEDLLGHQHLTNQSVPDHNQVMPQEDPKPSGTAAGKVVRVSCYEGKHRECGNSWIG